MLDAKGKWMLNCEYENQGTDLDDSLEELVGPRHASGYSFFDKARDIQWFFSDEASAKEAAEKIRKEFPHISVAVWKETEED